MSDTEKPPEEPSPSKPDRSQMSDRDLMLEILGMLDAVMEWRREVDEWRQKVDRRLDDGEKRFRKIENNTGIAMNALRDLCELRGLEMRKAQLDGALDEWAEDRASHNPELKEAPTNPSNSAPPPPSSHG